MGEQAPGRLVRCRCMSERLMSMVAAVVIGAALGGCGEAGRQGDELRVASPHRDEIKHEFESAFRAHYHRTTGRDVNMVWLDLGGGTSAIFRYLDEYSESPGASGVDVVFGGGTDKYVRMAPKGLFHAFRLPPAVLAKIQPEVGGVPIYDAQFRWYGATLSNFGIVYNKRVCQREGLPVPRTWRDLADPRVAGWVMCGDPRMSGVVHLTSEIVLQASGWREGWKTVLLTAANARGFTRASGEVLREVNTGEAAMGGCIDFYAFSLIAREGNDKIGYVAPEGATYVSPDSIAIVRHAKHLAVTKAFVRFVMSEAGQCLWILRPGAEQGPDRYALGRHTVMPHLYTERAAHLTVAANPFRAKSHMKYDPGRGGRRWTALNDLYASTIIQAHDRLSRTWRAVVRAGQPAELVAKLTHPPCSESELTAYAKTRKNVRQRVRQMEQWLTEARRRYQDVGRLARSYGPTTRSAP
jgi:iron(III) transport system substrate-binding protein